MTAHPFDRYAPFTDVAALKEWSSRPLRKSVRVNTLKSSVDDFRAWAEAPPSPRLRGTSRTWKIEQVPWCPEGFFIDRDDRSMALGKDLLHLMGFIYMQEAASMLPVALLDPQPGEIILDMSAAPGSKTTQIAARLRQGYGGQAGMQIPLAEMHASPPGGVLVANDVQEKRLWTLKTALYRLGCTNVIVTKKKGQWFGGHMTEAFDRVLLDAPCTAQGTARKDPTALLYCSELNIRKMARLQRELLEAAVHACKVGGRIVYSTCTLTPEENEEVVASVLNKFGDAVEVGGKQGAGSWWQVEVLEKAMEDSLKVQKHIANAPGYPLPATRYPLVRLWPQTCDTEGFFCAVLEKTARTPSRSTSALRGKREPQQFASVPFQEKALPPARQREVAAWLEDRYGTSFIMEGDQLFERNDQLLLATEDIANFTMPLIDFSLGIPFAKRTQRQGLRLDHEIVTLRGSMARENVVTIGDDELDALLDGKDTECDANLTGDIILYWNALPVGIGLAKDGVLKNRLPRWIVQKS